jgi:hypothetical protein
LEINFLRGPDFGGGGFND